MAKYEVKISLIVEVEADSKDNAIEQAEEILTDKFSESKHGFQEVFEFEAVKVEEARAESLFIGADGEKVLVG